jgi:hypothetical protein
MTKKRAADYRAAMTWLAIAVFMAFATNLLTWIQD